MARMVVAMNTATRILSALGVITRATPATRAPGARAAPPPRADVAPSLTRGQALGVDGVYRAVSIIATGVRLLTLDATRSGTPITPPPLIARPDPTPGTMLADVLGQTATSLAMRGNAYWQVGRDAAGAATAIRVLHPDMCVPYFDPETGARTVTTPAGTFAHGDAVYQLQLLDVMESYGIGPLQAYARGLATADAMAVYASQLARPGVPSGTLCTNEHLSPTEAEDVRAEWQKRHTDPNGVAVLASGVQFKPILLTDAEVQFIESRRLDTAAIARLFGVPPHLMNISSEGSSLTYQNVRDANTGFVTWGLGPYLSAIETAFSALLPRHVTARFNLDAFLRPSTRERYEAHKIALESKFMTIAEVRKIEKLEPLP